MNYSTLTKEQLVTIIYELENKNNNSSRDLFISNISHDIRTLLNAIYGNAQILNKADDLKQQHKTNVDKILDASSHMIDLINDIIDLSKNSGDDKVILCEFNLNDFLNNIFSIFETVTLSKDIKLKLENKTDRSTMIKCDKNKLFYIFLNLLGNAVKFTKKGTVLIKATYEEKGEDKILFEIIDTGIGIKEDMVDKILDNYVQASLEHNAQGSGLGLGIANKNIQLLGSKLNISSELNKGSNFSFSIKYIKKQKSFVSIQDDIFEIQEIKTIKNDQNFTILVYSQDKDQIAILKEYFTLKSISYKIVIDIDDIEDLIEQNLANMIFIDTAKLTNIQLNTLKNIKSNYIEFVLIAFTASVMSVDLNKINDIFTTYIVKPYSFIDIDQALILFSKQKFEYISKNNEQKTSNIIIEDNLKKDIIKQSKLCHYKNTLDLVNQIEDDHTKKTITAFLENYDFDEIIMELNR